MLALSPKNFDLLYNNLLGEFDYYGNKSSLNKASYSLVKEKDTVIFKTIATGLTESDISMSIENKKLIVKSESSSKDQFISKFDFKIPVGDVQIKNTKANLSKGILTINMPLKEDKKSFEIKF